MSTKDGVVWRHEGTAFPTPFIIVFFFLPVLRVCLFSHNMGSKVSLWIDYILDNTQHLTLPTWLFLLLSLFILHKHICILSDCTVWILTGFMSVRVAVFLCLPNDTSEVTSDSRAFSVKLTDWLSVLGSSYAPILSNSVVPIIFVLCQSFNMPLTYVSLTDDKGEDLSPKQAWHI